MSLEWDAPSSNGGFKITEYKYSYRESSSDSWDTEGSAGTEQEKTITGLTNSTEYEFRVRAKNSLGLGPWSDSINATPQPHLFGAIYRILTTLPLVIVLV